jgi:hypothetical protein
VLSPEPGVLGEAVAHGPSRSQRVPAVGRRIVVALLLGSIAMAAGCQGTSEASSKTCDTSDGHAICLWQREHDVFAMRLTGFTPNGRLEITLVNPSEPSAVVGPPQIAKMSPSGTFPSSGSPNAAIIMAHPETLLVTFTAEMRDTRTVTVRFRVTPGHVPVVLK